ncbi:hypothetical protein [Stenotrophomonas sp.]|uniref:hypothetical protein n=1 Tax=Stenotrophomonas sp. TaxID=69392 RepID=UPI0028B05166|nr:hypothetical protein [Stenotrophomonas sp.]
MKALGPLMLLWWEEASTCAQLYIEMAEKDQRINTLLAMRKIKNATTDVFALALFSKESEMPTGVVPLNPLIPEYRSVLDAWSTDDEAKFQAVMQLAADFHVSRSKENTDRNRYEFEATIDRVLPAELLAIQALRRKRKLPEFQVDADAIRQVQHHWPGDSHSTFTLIKRLSDAPIRFNHPISETVS